MSDRDYIRMIFASSPLATSRYKNQGTGLAAKAKGASARDWVLCQN